MNFPDGVHRNVSDLLKRSCTLGLICLSVCSSLYPQSSAWRKKLPSVGFTVGLNPRNENTIFTEGSSALIFISFDKGKTWTGAAKPGLTQIRQILVHPSDTNTIFCAAAGNLRKSTDFGASWHTVIANYDINGESISYDPMHPDTMYAGRYTGGDVYRSTDRGETWTHTGAAGNQLDAFAVRPDSSSILYGAPGSGTIAKSTDGGASWRIIKQPAPITVFQEVPKISISLSTPSVAYATINGDPHPTLGVWKTVDGGEHWIQTNAPHFAFWGMDIDPTNANIVYAGTFQDGITSVYKTTDGGTTWNSLSSGLPGSGRVWSVKISPVNTSELWSSLTDGSNGSLGVFRLAALKGTIQGTVSDSMTNGPVNNGFIINTTTEDTVRLASTGGTYTLGYFDGDPSLISAIHVEAYPYYIHDVQVPFSVDSNLHYDIKLHVLATGSLIGTVRDSLTHQPLSANIRLSGLTTVGAVTHVTTTDSLGRFRFDSLFITYPPINSYPSLTIDPEIPFAKKIFTSILLDTTGIDIPLDLPRAAVFIISAADSGKYLPYYIAACESLHTTYNTWDILRQGSAPLSRGLEFAKHDIVLYTGDSHAPFSQSLQDSIIACVQAGCNLFLTGQDIAEKNDSTPLLNDYLGIGFGGNSSVAFTTGLHGDIFDGTVFFTAFAGGADNQTSRDILAIKDSRVKPVMGYGSGSSGIASVRIDSVGSGGKAVVMGFGFEAVTGTDALTGVSERVIILNDILRYFDGSLIAGGIHDPSEGLKPRVFSLEQNYPNPFNPSTSISYHIAQRGRVILEVCDILGREITRLVDNMQSAGSYTVLFDASELSSGIYYYRLRTSGFVSVKKMLVIR